MRTMKKIAALATTLAFAGALAAPANARGHGHAAHVWQGGGHAWRGHGGYAVGGFGGGYYSPYYDDGYAYGYPYEYGYPYPYGYRDYDPGAAIALSMIGTIGNLIAHQAFRHGHYRHHYRHWHR